eukprot:TRINITY_DN8503_c0_g1_i1.p1 TRINITY_DN8503_c0_g1~~TRINITY_DN8503_c0_g1_i1.p1  ORF type:complete len:289 (+),score=25.89 TRINITY_DN8503_c0_g1_i1:112-978(+)
MIRRTLRNLAQARPPRLSAEVATTPAANARYADPNAVFVVSGASRGIGAEFCRQLLTRSTGRVIGLCRNPEAADVLSSTDTFPDRFSLVRCDVTDPSSVRAAAESVGARCDVLVLVAGLLGTGIRNGDRGPERALREVDPDWLRLSFATNTIGPLLVTQALAPALAVTAHQTSEGERPATLVAALSARVGSIGDNRLGGWWSYRMSKAALNMAVRNMAIELRRQRTSCVALHPGTTDTALSKPFQGNLPDGQLQSAACSVAHLLDVMDRVDDDASGYHFDYKGEPIEW